MADWEETDIWDEEEERKKRKKRREAEEQEDKTRKKKASKAEEETKSKDWKKMSPGGAVRTVFSGDRVLAEKHIGEGMNQLFILKNLMKLGKLPSLSLPPYILTDGTVIRVQSIYGQDQVIIESPFAIVAEVAALDKCTITLTDLPKIIQPMNHPGEIHSGEVSGKDYIKTYYSFNVAQCKSCKNISFEFYFTYKSPFEARHHVNFITGVPESDNHLIYSLAPPGKGEIISHGQDGFGKYIIWKAYTESSIYSRTGLGVILLTAQIKDSKENIICFNNNKITVDCCQKASSLRNVEIWWEDFGTCQPFMIYGGTTLCKMPESIPLSGSAGLIWYAILGEMYGGPGGALYVIPDVKGGCVPFEWTLTGYGELRTSAVDENKTTAFYRTTLGADCRSGVKIEARDRCGTTYTVNAYPVCDSPEYNPPRIQYTTLLMGCGQQQDLYALDGSAPYTWSVISGGGSIVTYDINGVGAQYTAPLDNGNCTQNPTIQLTDCCGNSATIALAVNCYTGGEALGYIYFRTCGPCAHDPYDPYGWCYIAIAVKATRYDCDGLAAVVCDLNPSCPSIPWYQQGGVGTNHCETPDYYSCGEPVSVTNCWTNACGCAGGGTNCPCNTLFDARTTGMKSQGCCPLNPITGLPY